MTTSIAANNSAILYSPYNWNVGSSQATTINPGAYFRVEFTGTTCVLNFNVTGVLTPLPQIWYRINTYGNSGGTGGWTKASVASTITCAIPSDTTSAATGPESPTVNFLEVVFKSSTVTQNRWAGVATAINFTGLTLDTGATVSLPASYPNNVIFYGTSITEGLRVMGATAASGNDVDVNDSMQGWAWLAASKLNAEFGIIGFGGTGLSITQSPTGVPPFYQSYNQIYSGVSRSFAIQPNLIWCDFGYNDGTNNTVADTILAMNGLLAACPGVPIAFMQEFPIASNSPQNTYIPAGIAACSNPSLVTYINTQGVWNSAQSGDGIHSFGAQNAALLGPYVATKCNTLLNSKRNPFFHSNFGP